MRNCLAAGVICAPILIVSSAVMGATVALTGSELSLRTIAQQSPGGRLVTTSFPVSATVSETDVEFPNVASLFDPTTGVPRGFMGALVDVSIDVGDDFIEIDFARSAPASQFAPAFQNTYVFTFDRDVALTITDAVIAREVTTLALTDERVTFEGNELFVNVESLTFDASTFVRIELTTETVPSGLLGFSQPPAGGD